MNNYELINYELRIRGAENCELGRGDWGTA